MDYIRAWRISKPKAVQKATQQMAQILSRSQTVMPVHAQELKALLPDNLPGMKRADASAQKTGVLGINVTMAKSTHRSKEGDGNLNVTITDLGRVKDAAMFAQAWLLTERDQQSDHGYERTTMYQGFPAYEKFEDRGGNMRAEMTIVLCNRFIIALKGRSLEMKEVKSALESININRLEGMKWDGAK